MKSQRKHFFYTLNRSKYLRPIYAISNRELKDISINNLITLKENMLERVMQKGKGNMLGITVGDI